MISIPHRASGWVSKLLSGFDGHRISDNASGNRAASSISQFLYWPSSSHGGSGLRIF
jgi:hypothetical protein